MDKQNIINNYKLYKIIEKNKNTVLGLELGLKFLDLFFDDLKEMESLSSDLNSVDLTNVNIYNYKENKNFFIKVSASLFQEHLQFFYRKFIDEYYFSNFSWYQKFSSNVKNTLQTEFNFDSIGAMNLMVRLVSDCFVIFSDGTNKYDYAELTKYLKNIFIGVGIDSSESKDLSIKIIDGLYKGGLVVNTDKKFLSIFTTDKKFSLSDRYIDVVFNLNSFFVPRVSLENSNEIKYNSKYLLNKLPNLLEKFINNKESKLSFNDMLASYYHLDLNEEKIKIESAELNKVILSLYFNKILLNEYCLQLVIVSCFNFYFLNPGLKNILYRYNLDD